MTIEKRIVPVKTGEIECNVPVYLVGNLNTLQDKVISFANGFCRDPIEYKIFMESVASSDELVIAPAISGIRLQDKYGNVISNNGVQVNRELHLAALKEISDELDFNQQNIRDISFSSTISHSAGGYINSENPQKIVLINPLMPVNYGLTGFISRGALIGANKLTFREGMPGFIHGVDLQSNSRYLKNFFGNLSNNLDLIRDFGNSAIDKIYPSNLHAHVLLLYSTRDEFFDAKKYIPSLRERFASLEVHELPGRHENIIYNPDKAVKLVKAFLRS